MFDKYSKKLVIENVHSKNEKVQGKLRSKLNLNGVPTSKIVNIHESMGESLNMSFGEMEKENPTLK
jgi:hypothetical protein